MLLLAIHNSTSTACSLRMPSRPPANSIVHTSEPQHPWKFL
jgi:hypothetical protein